MKEGAPTFVVPDAIEPIVGWKAWKLGETSQALLSPSHRTYWPFKRSVHAECARMHAWSSYRRQQHGSAPNEKCTCGIYIAKDAFTASAYGTVLGLVYGWGRVIEHAQGWRVEYAYPKEIFIADDSVIGDYGVPVTQTSFTEMFKMTRRRLDDDREFLKFMADMYGWKRGWNG